jgi:hypothetical protein
MEISRMEKRTPQRWLVIASLVLLMALVVSVLPQGSAAAVTCKFKHKVVEGETLIYLGNYYQVYWYKIADANNLQPPYAISAGQVLCIPEGEKPNTGTTTGSKDKKTPVLQAVLGLSDITVGVENFAPKTSYYIRLFPTGGSQSYRIGNFTTNKEGDATKMFNLSPFLPRTREMSVCVKNTGTDAVSCIKVFELGAYVPLFMGKRCNNKEGR